MCNPLLFSLLYSICGCFEAFRMRYLSLAYTVDGNF